MGTQQTAPALQRGLPLRVLLACSGLDHAKRGFESFARECFEALQNDPGVSLQLVKASGPPSAGEHAAWTLLRDSHAAAALSRLSGRPSFRVEAALFAAGLVPVIRRLRPDLVYLSEWDTALALARFRRLTRARFKLLLCNGGFAATGFEHLDHVQQLTPAALKYVLDRGADPERHSVLPLGFRISEELTPVSRQERTRLRDRLDLPDDRRVLLSAAALNRHHKRLDYLIDEVAALPEPRPFLLMVGESEKETPMVRAQAVARLGPAGFSMRTLPQEQMEAAYRAADALALASLEEMQGRVLVEAASHGLPVLAHDSEVMRYALGDHGFFGDFGLPGNLTALVLKEASLSSEARRRRIQLVHRHVRERFSWAQLKPRYLELFARVAWANSTVSSSTGEKLST